MQTTTLVNICESLGIGIVRAEREPYFTGWKLVSDEKGGFVGQLAYWYRTETGRRALYVNLPGMETGSIPEDYPILHRERRATGNESVEEVRELLRAGMVELQKLIDYYIAPVAERTTAQPSEG